MERQATALIGRCYAGLGAAALREEVLRRMLPVDAAFFATVDPMTLLFTSAAADEPLGAATPLFLANEFGREDVNKFTALAQSADPVASLDRATRGHRPGSARYRGWPPRPRRRAARRSCHQERVLGRSVPAPRRRRARLRRQGDRTDPAHLPARGRRAAPCRHHRAGRGGRR
jgi:hypothetical protein